MYQKVLQILKRTRNEDNYFILKIEVINKPTVKII